MLSIKHHYATTLSNLEHISDEIHRQRQKANINNDLGRRGVGVGAESPVPISDNSTTDRASINSTKREQNLNADTWSAHHHEKCPSCHHITDNDDADDDDVVETEKDIRESTVVNTVILRSKPVATVCRPYQPTVSKPAVSTHPDSTLSLSVQSVSKSPVLPAPVSKSVSKRHPLSTEHPVSTHPASGLPTVQVTSASAPASPTKPDPAQDLANKNVRDNAELMASIQRDKSKPLSLRTCRTSLDDLLEYHSDTESLSGSVASTSMLDDEQIQSLMLEMTEYTKFIEKMDEKQAKSWKRLSLPAKLTQLEKNFNLDEFLAEARIVEESDVMFTEKLAPMAQEEDDFCYEIIENEDVNE